MINECNLCGCVNISCITAEQLYGSKYRYLNKYFYKCEKCSASVGCHGNTKKPLGTLATKQNRDLRNKCHKLFDPLWQSKNDGDYTTGSRGEERKKLYKYIGNKMGLPMDKMHFGMFDTSQCIQALSIIQNLIDVGFERCKNI